MDILLERKAGGLKKAFFFRLSLALIILGAVGKAVFENRLAKGENTSEFLTFGGIALLLQALSLGAVPILVFLFSEWIGKIKNKRKAALQLFLFSLLLEIPCNLVMAGRILDTGGRNPAFAFLLCFCLYCLWNRSKRLKIPINIAVTLCAFFWALSLSIQEGVPCVLIFCACWWLRQKESLRLFAMTVALGILSFMYPLYILALPTSALLHFYKGED